MARGKFSGSIFGCQRFILQLTDRLRFSYELGHCMADGESLSSVFVLTLGKSHFCIAIAGGFLCVYSRSGDPFLISPFTHTIHTSFQNLTFKHTLSKTIYPYPINSQWHLSNLSFLRLGHLPRSSTMHPSTTQFQHPTRSATWLLHPSTLISTCCPARPPIHLPATLAANTQSANASDIALPPPPLMLPLGKALALESKHAVFKCGNVAIVEMQE